MLFRSEDRGRKSWRFLTFDAVFAVFQKKIFQKIQMEKNSTDDSFIDFDDFHSPRTRHSVDMMASQGSL